MSDTNARDAKLIQYLTEAYGKEKELETALEAHIGMARRGSYKKRLREHLKETRSHGREVERRIKQLGGGGHTLVELTSRGMALAKGPLHALRGSGEAEKELKNAKTEYSEEAEEIATYTAIEALAESVGDRETARLARSIRRDEERMARFLERLIPTLTKAVAREEIPAAERNGGRSSSRRRGTPRRTSAGRKARGTRAPSSRKRAPAKRAPSRRTSSRRTARSSR